MATRIVSAAGNELLPNADGSLPVSSTSTGATVTVVQSAASLLNSTATITGSASIYASSTSATVTVAQPAPSLNQSRTEFRPLSSVTFASVAASTTSAALSAANTSRKKLAIANASTGILYVRKGSATSIVTSLTSLNFSFSIASLGYYEEPQPIWQGSLDGIFGTASGQANVTEET